MFLWFGGRGGGMFEVDCARVFNEGGFGGCGIPDCTKFGGWPGSCGGFGGYWIPDYAKSSGWNGSCGGFVGCGVIKFNCFIRILLIIVCITKPY